MTPNEKAAQLVVDNQTKVRTLDYKEAVACAIITVEEIIKTEPSYPSNVDWDDCGATHQYYYETQREEALKFWNEVKQILERL